MSLKVTKAKQGHAMENFVLVRNQMNIDTVDTPTGKQYDINVRGVHGVLRHTYEQETMVEEDDRETFPVALNVHFLLDTTQKDPIRTTNDHS